MSFDCKEFCDFLLRQASKYDEAILRDFRHPDIWVGKVTTGISQPDWWESREEVRMLSEGVAYVRSEEIKEDYFDRFESVFPKIGYWERSNESDIIGDPCDHSDHSWAKLPC